MLGELRPFGVAADDDVGERLVVAQQHVERGLKRLIRLFSSSRASASLPVTENSMVLVPETMRSRRLSSRVGWV